MSANTVASCWHRRASWLLPVTCQLASFAFSSFVILFFLLGSRSRSLPRGHFLPVSFPCLRAEQSREASHASHLALGIRPSLSPGLALLPCIRLPSSLRPGRSLPRFEPLVFPRNPRWVIRQRSGATRQTGGAKHARKTGSELASGFQRR